MMDISGDVDNLFTDPTGPITVNYYQERIRRGRDPWTLNSNLLAWLGERFVPPDGYVIAERLLFTSGLAVVHGSAGIGRRTAALMLLLHNGSAAVGYRELPNRQEEEDERLGSTAVEPGDRLLLDLTSVQDLAGQANELESLCASVQRTGARLVVAISSEQRDQLPPLHPWLVQLGRPDSRQVLLRHLAADEIHPTSNDLDVPRLDQLLAREPMSSIAALSELIREARNTKPDQAFDSWLEAAFTALAEQGRAVAKQVKEHPGGPFRALLVAVAFFEGMSADVVHAAEHELQRVLALPSDERHVLERADLAERLEEIGASVDPGRGVGFTRLAYGSAVRAHFWHNFPALREAFREWIGATVRLDVLSEDESDRLVDRFAERCLGTGGHRDLLALARSWGKEGLSPAARRALVVGLQDPDIGWEFRRRIYWWSRERALGRGFANVLVTVCVEEIASTRPEQALVRLVHLSRNHDEQVSSNAKDALRRLADSDNRFFRRLLFRVAGTVDDVFLELVWPARLTESHGAARPLILNRDVRTALANGWASALATEPRQRLTGHVVAWLPDDRLLAVLVDACGTRAGLFNTLFLIARDWVRDAVDPGEVELRSHAAARLHRALDIAFGITTEENHR